MAWALAFLEAGWTIQWMKWTLFLDLILKGNFNHILDMPVIKLIARGLSLAIDYMYLTHTLIFYIASDTLFSSPSNTHPGLDSSNFDLFWNNLLKLSLHIPMFPHPQDLLASASKIQRDNDLMVVATNITKTPFPKSVTLNNETDLLIACRRPGYVIKCDFSDSNDCTYLPSNEGEDAKVREQRIKQKLEETKISYRGIRSLPHPNWMGQTYIPSLVEKGELWAFVVGGKVSHVIHTLPANAGNLKIQFVENFTHLSILK